MGPAKGSDRAAFRRRGRRAADLTRSKIGALRTHGRAFGCAQKHLRRRAPMKRYIGLDVHAASTTFGVISEAGKQLGSHVVETNRQALLEQLKTIPGKRHVVLEEGTQSAWLYEILTPHAEEVVVAVVAESRGQK